MKSIGEWSSVYQNSFNEIDPRQIFIIHSSLKGRSKKHRPQKKKHDRSMTFWCLPPHAKDEDHIPTLHSPNVLHFSSCGHGSSTCVSCDGAPVNHSTGSWMHTFLNGWRIEHRHKYHLDSFIRLIFVYRKEIWAGRMLNEISSIFTTIPQIRKTAPWEFVSVCWVTCSVLEDMSLSLRQGMTTNDMMI